MNNNNTTTSDKYKYKHNNKFWINNITVLFDPKHILNIPSSKHSLEYNLNCFSRYVILYFVFMTVYYQNIFYLLFCLVFLLLITVIYYYFKSSINIENFKNQQTATTAATTATTTTTKDKKKINTSSKTQTIGGNNNVSVDIMGDKITFDDFISKNYYDINPNNPFGNVLLTEINDNPDKLSAAPSFNPLVKDKISKKIKKFIQNNNKGIDVNHDLFGTLYDDYTFEHDFLRNFYSMPNTKVCSDQGAFSQYLYGDMPSCRGGDALQCAIDNQRYILI